MEWKWLIIAFILLLLLFWERKYDRIASRRRRQKSEQKVQEAFEAELAADRPEVLEAKAEAYVAEADIWKAKAEELETWAEEHREQERAEKEALKKIPNPAPGSRAASVQGLERTKELHRKICVAAGIEFRERKPFPSLLEKQAAKVRKLEREARKLAAEARHKSGLQRKGQELTAKIRQAAKARQNR